MRSMPSPPQPHMLLRPKLCRSSAPIRLGRQGKMEGTHVGTRRQRSSQRRVRASCGATHQGGHRQVQRSKTTARGGTQERGGHTQSSSSKAAAAAAPDTAHAGVVTPGDASVEDFFNWLVELSNISMVGIEGGPPSNQPSSPEFDAWFTVIGVDGESGVYQIPLESERARLQSLGAILEFYPDREEAEEAFEEAMLEGAMPNMHWFVAVPNAATGQLELLCTVTAEPPTRPDCDVFAFGEDDELARAHFVDNGGVLVSNTLPEPPLQSPLPQPTSAMAPRPAMTLPGDPGVPTPNTTVPARPWERPLSSPVPSEAPSQSRGPGIMGSPTVCSAFCLETPQTLPQPAHHGLWTWTPLSMCTCMPAVPPLSGTQSEA